VVAENNAGWLCRFRKDSPWKCRLKNDRTHDRRERGLSRIHDQLRNHQAIPPVHASVSRRFSNAPIATMLYPARRETGFAWYQTVWHDRTL